MTTATAPACLTPQDAVKLPKDQIIYLVKPHNDHGAGGTFVVRSTVELQGRVFVTAAPNIDGAKPISLDNTYWSIDSPGDAPAGASDGEEAGDEEGEEGTTLDYTSDEGTLPGMFRDFAPEHDISQEFYATITENEDDGPYADGVLVTQMSEANVDMGKKWGLDDVSRMFFLYCKSKEIDVPQIVLDVNKELEDARKAKAPAKGKGKAATPKEPGVMPPGVVAADAALTGRTPPPRPAAPTSGAGDRVQIDQPGGWVAVNLAGVILQHLPYAQNSGSTTVDIIDQAVAMAKAALAVKK